MDKTYKAVPYKVTKHHDGEVESDKPYDNIPAYDTVETRYCIVSTDTGEVLDDAQGYGYKTAKRAYLAYTHRTRDKTKDNEKALKRKHIQQWMKEHKSFVKAMDTVAFENAKCASGNTDGFGASVVREMLSEFGLTPDFTAGELLNVWRDKGV